MTITVNIDVKKQLVTQEISDQIQLDEMLNAFESLYLNSDFDSSMAILVIIQPGSTSSVGSDDVHKLVTLMRQYAGVRGRGKSAIVAVDASDFGMSHAIQFLLKDELREVMVFDNENDAKHWLGL